MITMRACRHPKNATWTTDGGLTLTQAHKALAMVYNQACLQSALPEELSDSFSQTHSRFWAGGVPLCAGEMALDTGKLGQRNQRLRAGPRKSDLRPGPVNRLYIKGIMSWEGLDE